MENGMMAIKGDSFMRELEKTGEKFNLKTYLEARETCIRITEEVIQKIEEGMGEKDIKLLLENSFKHEGISKFWHPTKVRVGADTTKSFRELSDPEIRCHKNEMCFVDVGPIINDHEADYGRTFVFGGLQPNKLIQTCHEVFQKTSEKWKTAHLTGAELFAYANGLAQEQGFELNPLSAGHRLGDFPHKLYSSAKLFELGMSPAQNLWVLEIHVVDRKNQRGAFFEDILM